MARELRAGEPCWVGCDTDLDTAPAFYAALFGWTTESMGPDAGNYTMASKDGALVCGFGAKQDPGPPVWTTFFKVDDAAKAAQVVGEGGGTVVMEPVKVLEEGTIALFKDPTGAAFAVWQPQRHQGFAAEGPGTFCWAELVTTDVARSSAFYESLLGVTVKQSADGTMEYYELQLGDRSVAGMMPKPSEIPAEVPPFWGVYFSVEDTDATLARIAELGGGTLAGPMDVPPGRFATCHDPLGAVFSVIALAT